MEAPLARSSSSEGVSSLATPWFQRLSRPILFLVVSLALVGAYLAFTIPVSVFPQTDFPRIVIAVVHPDDDARKIRLGKNGDWNCEREVRSHQRQAHHQKEDGTRQPLKPWRRQGTDSFGRATASERSLHPGYSFSAAGWTGFVGAIFTAVPSGKPYPPVVMTASPSFTPETICTASVVRIPVSTFRACATPSTPATRTYCTSSAFFCKATAGTTIASLMVRAVIETLTVMPGLIAELGFEASTHTSIVVLPGSSAGLTSVTRPSTSRSSPGSLIRAGSPAFNSAACAAAI